MIHVFARPRPLVALLAFCTFIPVLMAAVRVLQIPSGALPDDNLRLATVPFSFFFHALGGLLFGVLGPLQFVLALQGRFGALHRLAGRIFVVAGVGLALSGWGLLFQVESRATALLDVARAAFSLTLMATLALGVAAARARRLVQHRQWMIRAYVIGMGSGTVALIMFPFYLVTGQPVTGLVSDLVVVGVWLINLAVGEWVIGRMAMPMPLAPAATSPKAG